MRISIQGETAQHQPMEYAVVDKSKKKNRKKDEQQNVRKEQLKSSNELYLHENLLCNTFCNVYTLANDS